MNQEERLEEIMRTPVYLLVKRARNSGRDVLLIGEKMIVHVSGRELRGVALAGNLQRFRIRRKHGIDWIHV